MPPKSWPQEDMTALRELAEQGLSASQIASQLGKTRNAVIGVVTRQRIELGRRTSTEPMKDYTPVKPEVVVVPGAWPKPNTPTMVGFTKTQDHHCRMPLWGDLHRTGNVCGRPRQRKSYYCRECNESLTR